MTADDKLKKLVLPTPADGQTLIEPPLTELDSVWESNLSQIAETNSAAIEMGNQNLRRLRSTARAELIQLAHTYSASYGVQFSFPKHTRIVMAGHQPELFHPGVWFKNVLLSRLAEQWNAVGINLIVDNDLCGSTAIQIPQMVDQKPISSWTRFDGPGANRPFEERRLEDAEVFESFAKRAGEKIATFVQKPILNELWPHVIESATCLKNGDGVNLGAVLAAGRHRLESEHGLRTLEIPLSKIAATESFSTFVFHALTHHRRLREVYNGALVDYRKVYNLRSRSHPVPELEERGAMTETPFWIWHQGAPQRKRLFVQHLDTTFLLHDGEDWYSEVKEKWAVDDLQFYEQQGIKIRPRALMTTLYSRLVLSDLFIHGIGGAKYDQLTDLIADSFFGIALPKYATASATYRLPTDTSPVSARDITNAEQQLRELRFHPERSIDFDEHPAAEKLAQQKSDWIKKTFPQELQTARHHEIDHCNRGMQRFVDSQRETLQKNIGQLQQQYLDFQNLGSREFSFCLFPESIIDSLRNPLVGQQHR